MCLVEETFTVLFHFPNIVPPTPRFSELTIWMEITFGTWPDFNNGTCYYSSPTTLSNNLPTFESPPCSSFWSPSRIEMEYRLGFHAHQDRLALLLYLIVHITFWNCNGVSGYILNCSPSSHFCETVTGFPAYTIRSNEFLVLKPTFLDPQNLLPGCYSSISRAWQLLCTR